MPSLLPDRVEPMLSGPYWRADIRPLRYQKDRIAFNRLETAAREAQVRLRGWYFPHITERNLSRGTNFIDAWAASSNYEYWRFTQSAQLVHLHGVREVVDTSWKSKIEEEVRNQLDWIAPDWDSIKGYINITNFVYTVTEYFEFARRLTTLLDLNEAWEIRLSLVHIDGFILTADISKSWDDLFQWSGGRLENSWEIAPSDLRLAPQEKAIDVVIWFFQRFGWTDPSVSVLRADQAKLYRHEI